MKTLSDEQLKALRDNILGSYLEADAVMVRLQNEQNNRVADMQKITQEMKRREKIQEMGHR